MPIVLTFWQLLEEEDEFIEFLKGTGDVIAVHSGAFKNRETLDPEPIDAFIIKYDPDQLRFGLKHLFSGSEIIRKDFEGELLYAVEPMKPCLVSYNRPKFRDGKLGQSNLAAYSTFPNVQATALIKKDPEFIKWTNKIVSWMRKRVRHKIELNGFPYPATEKAKAAFVERKLEVCF